VLIVAGIAVTAIVLAGRTLDAAALRHLVRDHPELIAGQFGVIVGVLALVAALVVWLVRGRRNRLAHPPAGVDPQPAPGAEELAPIVDA